MTGLRFANLLSVGINACFLALFVWIWVNTQSDVVVPWIGYFAYMGALSTMALRKGKSGVRV